MSKTYVIVGAGLAGLFAARMLRILGRKDIYVIEKSDNVGGLLQHIKVENPLGNTVDYTFDYGTHFVLGAGHKDIDLILSQDIDDNDYHEYRDSLQEGHYINGALYEQSGCANIGHFSSDVQETIKNEMKEKVSEDKDEPSENLYNSSVSKYGQTASDLIFVPTYKKLTGQSPEDLSIKMEGSLFPPRLIVTDREESKKMKQDPAWDERIAFADCADSTSDIVKKYPKKDGIGKWLKTMTENLEKEGVKIKRGCTIANIEREGNSIKSVMLSNDKKIKCDHLIWTLPPIFLALASKVTVPSLKPIMRNVAVVNFLTDQKPIERPYWITIYDPAILSFRVTLYDNFAPSEDTQSAYRITVEILHEGSFEGSEEDQKKIFDELKKMQIISKNSNRLWSNVKNKPEGFPVLTSGVIDTTMQQIKILEKEMRNISIVGRRPDKGHGQIPIMTHIYHTLKFLSDKKEENIKA